MDTQTLNINKTEFRSIDKSEPEWLYNLRREAWDIYQTTPLPDNVVHLWRYTKPKWFLMDDLEERMNVLPQTFDFGENQMAPLSEEFSAFGCNHGDRIIYTQIAKELLGSGIIFKDLLSAAKDNENLVQKYLGKLINAGFGKFEALNLALWNSGMFLYIPKGLRLTKPIYLHRHPNGNYNVHRVLIVLDEDSEATVIDDFADRKNPDPFQVNSIAEIFVGESSKLRYVNPQNLASKTTSHITTRAQVERQAQIYTIFASLGSEVSKNNIGNVLNGQGANSQMLGVSFADDRQHFDHHTMHHHKAGDTYSNIDFKVAVSYTHLTLPTN